MVAETAIIAIIVAALAVLYGIALTGDHPLLSKHLTGLNENRPDSRALRVLPFVVALAAAIYALFFFEGEFGAPMGTARWWIGVAVAIIAVVLGGGSLLRTATS